MDNAFRLDVAALATFEFPVVKLDPQGICTYGNAAAARLLGAESAVGVSLADLFPDEDQRKLVLEELAKRMQGIASSYTTEFTRPSDKKRIPVSIFAVPLLNDRNRVGGSMAIITDLRISNAKRTVHQTIETASSSRAILEALKDQLKLLLPFDLLRVTAVSHERTHLRTLYTTESRAEAVYPLRWWFIPDSIRQMIEDKDARVLDMRKLLAEPRFVEMAKNDAALQRYIQLNVSYSLTIPILRGHQVAAMITVEREGGLPFTKEDISLCRRLPLAEAVKMSLHHEEENNMRGCLDLIRKMGTTPGRTRDVAQLLVDTLAEQFEWDHVAMFQYDDDTRSFLVLSQASGTGKQVDESRFAAGEGGVVAHAWRDQEIVNVPNVKKCKEYREGVEGMKSELALPIPGDPARWVLNIESSLETAFAQEEIDLLRPLLTEASHVLERIWLLDMRGAVFRAMQDGVIETNKRGSIRRLNGAALRLLRGKDEQEFRGRRLSDFFADADEGKLLSETEFTSREVEMKRGDGSTVPVMLSASALIPNPSLPTGLGGRVFIASDLTFQRQVEHTLVGKEVFRHASLESRVPLALATGWLNAIVARHPDAQEDVKKILEQLRKVDLPLERLLRDADSLDRDTSVLRPVSLREVVDDVIAQLPRDERDALQFAVLAGDALVRASAQDIRFCVESCLSFAFRTKPQNKKVSVKLASDASNVLLTVSGDWEPDLGEEVKGGIWSRWRRTAASDLALADDLIVQIAARAKGSFKVRMDEYLELTLTLPALKEG